jgi:hypothetical protein
MLNAIATMKKEKQHSSLINNKTSQKQKNITNAKLQHLQHFMMINYILLWHFPSFQNVTTLHPLGHIFIQALT